jgi:GNAT superfamily N-acetyltransferase
MLIGRSGTARKNPQHAKTLMSSVDVSQIHFSQVPVDILIPLRHRMLRQGMPVESAHFPGDDLPATIHFAATVLGHAEHQSAAEVVAVSCLTLMESEWEGQAAWQLRGMATANEYQGLGVGRQLFEFAMGEAKRKHPDWRMWCNARVAAIGFYERVGWEVVSEEFDIPYAGPHKKMVVRLPAETSSPN